MNKIHQQQIMTLSDVMGHIKTVKKPIPSVGLAVRKCIFSIAPLEKKSPVLMSLLNAIVNLERALLNGEDQMEIDKRRLNCIGKLEVFVAAYPQE